MIKTHETDPRCCASTCKGLVYPVGGQRPMTYFFCQRSSQRLEVISTKPHDPKLLRTVYCLKKYGVQPCLD